MSRAVQRQRSSCLEDQAERSSEEGVQRGFARGSCSAHVRHVWRQEACRTRRVAGDAGCEVRMRDADRA